MAALKELQSLDSAPVFALPTLVSLLQQLRSRETVQVIGLIRKIGPDAAETVPRLYEILKTTAETPKVHDDDAGQELADQWRLAADLRAAVGHALAELGEPGETAVRTFIEMLRKPGPSRKVYRQPRKLEAPSAEGYGAMLYRRDDNGTYVDHRDMLLASTLSGLAAFGQRAKPAQQAIEVIRDDPETLPLVAYLAKETLALIVASESAQPGTDGSNPPD